MTEATKTAVKLSAASIVENAIVLPAEADAPAGYFIPECEVGIGENYPEKLTATHAETVRAERDKRLAASDWTQVADAPVDQAAWAAYRQALRDVPEQLGFPNEVVWPTQP